MTLKPAHITLLAAVMLMAVCFACGDDKEIDRSYTHYRYDIVTYMGVDDSGQEVYSLESRTRNDAVTLIATGSHAPQDSYVGRRLLLRYAYSETGDTTAAVRSITAFSAHAIISDSLRYTVKPLRQYLAGNSPMRLRSVWRTGPYINMHGQLEYTGRSRHFYMIIDSTTWHADTVQCYMVHNVYGDTTRHWREFYASFYVGTVWRNNDHRVLRLHMPDELHPADSIHDFQLN